MNVLKCHIDYVDKIIGQQVFVCIYPGQLDVGFFELGHPGEPIAFCESLYQPLQKRVKNRLENIIPALRHRVIWLRIVDQQQPKLS